MILEPFRYFSPSTLEEAIDILSGNRGESKIIAGGQSLIPLMKLGAEISCIVDLKKIRGINLIEEVKNDRGNISAVKVGALSTYHEIESSGIVGKHIPLLSRTAGGIGHPLVRNRGTIGGSLSHCDPAADLCAAALALDATVSIYGPGQRARTLDAHEFFRGPLETDLQADEILTSVIFPVTQLRTGYDVQKLTLGHGDFPVFIVAVSLHHDNSMFRDVAIALGGVAETSIRAKECESLLEGRENITDSDLEQVSRLIMDTFDPPFSNELSQDYTREMLGVYTKRGIRNAARMITG